MEEDKGKGQYSEGQQINKPKLKTISEGNEDNNDPGQYQEKIDDGIRNKQQDLQEKTNNDSIKVKVGGTK